MLGKVTFGDGQELVLNDDWTLSCANPQVLDYFNDLLKDAAERPSEGPEAVCFLGRAAKLLDGKVEQLAPRLTEHEPGAVY